VIRQRNQRCDVLGTSDLLVTGKTARVRRNDDLAIQYAHYIQTGLSCTRFWTRFFQAKDFLSRLNNSDISRTGIGVNMNT